MAGMRLAEWIRNTKLGQRWPGKEKRWNMAKLSLAAGECVTYLRERLAEHKRSPIQAISDGLVVDALALLAEQNDGVRAALKRPIPASVLPAGNGKGNGNKHLGRPVVRAPRRQNVGKWIKRHRERLGFNIKEFADLVGVHPTQMGHWERGTRIPLGRNVQKIKETLVGKVPPATPVRE